MHDHPIYKNKSQDSLVIVSSTISDGITNITNFTDNQKINYYLIDIG